MSFISLVDTITLLLHPFKNDFLWEFKDWEGLAGAVFTLLNPEFGLSSSRWRNITVVIIITITITITIMYHYDCERDIEERTEELEYELVDG